MTLYKYVKGLRVNIKKKNIKNCACARHLRNDSVCRTSCEDCNLTRCTYSVKWCGVHRIKEPNMVEVYNLIHKNIEKAP